jgi:hypothetical protein
MSKKLHPIPARDPVSGGEFYVSELRNDESDISLRGHFALPKYARLDPEQAHFLETFLRCRGTISAVEKLPNSKSAFRRSLANFGTNSDCGGEETRIFGS